MAPHCRCISRLFERRGIRLWDIKRGTPVEVVPIQTGS